jgi:phasin family protein
MAARKSTTAAAVKTKAPAEVDAVTETVEAVEAIEAVEAVETIEATPEVEQVEAAVETIQAPVKQEIKTMSEQFAISQVKVKEGLDKAIKTTEELVSFSQGNVEAFVKSGQIFATGLQDLSKQFTATAQASVEEAVSTFKAFSGVKSLKEALDLSGSVTKSNLEKAISESSKLTDATVKLAEQAFAPLSARFTLAAEKFTKTV